MVLYSCHNIFNNNIFFQRRLKIHKTNRKAMCNLRAKIHEIVNMDDVKEDELFDLVIELRPFIRKSGAREKYLKQILLSAKDRGFIDSYVEIEEIIDSELDRIRNSIDNVIELEYLT